MAKKKTITDELHALQMEFGVSQKVSCSEEESQVFSQMLLSGQALPEGVYKDIDTFDGSRTAFYRAGYADLSEEEKQDYYALKKLSLLKTIKNCAVFFTALTICGTAAYIIYLLSL